MTVMLCPTPQAAPISAEPTTLRSRLTIVAMATTWSASVACRIPRKKPRNRKDTTFTAVPVIALAKLVIPGRIMQPFDPTPIPICACAPWHGRGAGPIGGARQENASNQEARARFRFYQNGKDLRNTAAARENNE